MRFLLPLLTLCLVSRAVSADTKVVSVSPRPNTTTADPNTPVTASFAAPVDPASVTEMTFAVFGLWSGVTPGEIEVSQDGLSAVFTPSRPFSAGERVTVSVAKSIKSIDGVPMASGYSWHFMVRTSPATLSPIETGRVSVRRKGEGWIQTYGAYAGDFNEDGYTDLAVPNERSNDFRLFLNDGTGYYPSFDTYPIPSGSRPSVNEGADFDRDGHMDYVVGNSTGATISLFLGNGKGTLEPRAAFPVGFGVRGLAVLDLNGDNFPDVATASRQESVVATLINNGAGAFHPAVTFTTPAEGETAATAADMNEDGIMDLVLGAFESGQIVVLTGDGDGGVTFYDRFNAAGFVWMIVSGDVNGDGHADIATANSDGSSVSVLFGDGNGNLSSPTVYDSDVFTIAIDLGDLDGDGDLDMVSSNFGSLNVLSTPGSWIVYENDGAGVFTRRRTYMASSAGSCVVLHDRNNDGTLDITAIDEVEDELVLFTNESVATSTNDEALPTASFELNVYPNPVESLATLEYAIESTSPVSIDMYDVTGRKVVSLFEGTRPAGTHHLTFDTRSMIGPSGFYFLTVSAEGRRMTREFVIRH